MAIAIGAAVSVAAAAASSAIGGSGGGSGSSSGSGGGLNVLQTQMANSVKFGQGPSIGAATGNESPSKENPDMPMPKNKPTVEKSASRWNINSTPTQAVGDNQAQKDGSDIWADRLSKYLDYNTRSLG